MSSDVSLLGTGLLGAPVVRRLLSTGLSVTCWNRTTAKAEALRGAGAVVAPSAAEAVAASPVLLLYLADAAAIREAILAPPAARGLSRKTVVQMGTIAPSESVALEREVRAHGAGWLEAPVLGSGPQALSGTLIILAGGDPALFARCRPLLERLGPDPLLVGEVGSAALLKLALNNLIGSLTASFGVSLALVRAAGIDPEHFMRLLRPSALFAPTFDKKLPMILSGDFSAANFPARHMLKDMRLVEAEAVRLGVDPGVARAVESILERTLARGLGDADYSALASSLIDGAPGAAPAGTTPGPLPA